MSSVKKHSRPLFPTIIILLMLIALWMDETNHLVFFGFVLTADVLYDILSVIKRINNDR